MLQGEESVAKLENRSSGTKKIGEVFDAEHFFCEKWAYFLLTKKQPKKRCGFIPKFCPRSASENMQQLQNI